MRCPMCHASARADYQKFQSDYGGKIVEVPNIAVYKCTNPECDMEWLPHEEEMKIDDALEAQGIESSRQRYLKKRQSGAV